MPYTWRTKPDVLAGCFECYGSEYHWHGSNAQALAAQHHKRTGHHTWADVTISFHYGDDDSHRSRDSAGGDG